MADPEAIIKHYSSQFYDPAKAHAYYEKTKQLKGRPALTKNQAKVEAVDKDQQRTQRKAALDKLSAQQTARLAQIQSDVTKAKAQIEANMKAAMNKTVQNLLSDVATIPPGTNPKQRAVLLLRQKAAQADAKQAATKAVQALGVSMHAEVAKARASYAAARKNTNSKFDAAAITEDNNIRAQVR